MYDVIVSGAGPSGSYLSHLLSKDGFKVLLLEEHREVGKPVACSGLVSKRVFSFVRSRSEVNSVTGAVVHFPGGGTIRIGKPERTIVMDRDVFDRDAAGMAIASGADLHTESRVVGVRTDSQGALVRFRERGSLREERANVVVGADGINSRVRRDLFGTRPSRIVTAYQVDAALEMEDQDSVEVFIGSEYSKGFFGWAIPSGRISRIGAGSYGFPAREHFRRIAEKIGATRILGINGGAIPISYLRRTYADRALLVGDAAGITKPLSGGGIFTGIVSSIHASRTLREAFDLNRFDSTFLSRYERYWKKDIGRELWLDGVVQKYFSSLSDRTLQSIHSILSSRRNVRTINRLGDIDFPSRVVIGLLLRNPSLAGHLMARR